MLTDAALKGAADLGIVGGDKVGKVKQDAGKVSDRENAGGTTAATAGDGTALGTAPLGEGKVSIFGAVLPDASQKFHAGNALLVNALRSADAENTAGSGSGPGEEESGGGLALIGVAALAGGTTLRRARARRR